MAACGRSGNDGQAEWLLQQMRDNGVTPNRISYSAAMFALAKAGRLQDVSVFSHATRGRAQGYPMMPWRWHCRLLSWPEPCVT